MKRMNGIWYIKVMGKWIYTGCNTIQDALVFFQYNERIGWPDSVRY